MSNRSPPSPSGKRKSPPTPKVDVDSDGFTKVPTREEKRKQRKVDRHRPQFQYNTQDFRYGKKVGIAHIRDLVLYIVAEGQKPNWVQVDNKAFISHTVVLFAPGLLPEHLGLAPVPMAAVMPFSTAPPSSPVPNAEPLPPARVPIVPKLFTYACPTRAPGDNRKMHSVLNTLLMSPLPDSMKKKKEAESKARAELARSDDTPPFLHLLTPHQMIDNDYNLPSYITPSDTVVIPGLDTSSLPPALAAALAGSADTDVHVDIGISSSNGAGPSRSGKGNSRNDPWVETAEASGPPADGKYPVLAMDCEMVVSEDGQELARVSVIDFETGKNVYDELVRPPKSVTDYRTQWSGITAERLKHATHTLASVQSALISGPTPLITSHTILLGHSLECDLNALRIRHPLCIDTAVLYKHPRGPLYKPGLKWLAQKWLHREIQGSEHGHDSEEDARTCVDLLKLKLVHGPDFGNMLDNMEPIFERLNRFMPDSAKPGKRSAYCDFGNPRAMYGSKATTAVRCNTDDEVVDAMCEHVETHDVVFGRMMELASAQGWNSRGSEPSDSAIDPEALEPALERFNARLTKLHSFLPANTALILLTGHSNPLPMLELVQKRQKWERLVKTYGGTEGVAKEDCWMAQDERELESAVGQAREGMAFFCVKGDK